MENATKALLIAGSVLVAILLIAMGLKIFNSASGTTESVQTTMETTAITTFNTQFSSYLNKQITATQANALEQKIIASNAVNKNHKITFTNKGEGTYTATYSDGYITEIK